MERLMEAIRAIRNRRAEMNVPPSRKAQVYVETGFADTFRNGAVFMERLASASEVLVGEKFDIDGAVSVVTGGATIKMRWRNCRYRCGKARLEKEKAGIQKQLDGVLAGWPTNRLPIRRRKTWWQVPRKRGAAAGAAGIAGTEHFAVGIR